MATTFVHHYSKTATSVSRRQYTVAQKDEPSLMIITINLLLTVVVKEF